MAGAFVAWGSFAAGAVFGVLVTVGSIAAFIAWAFRRGIGI